MKGLGLIMIKEPTDEQRKIIEHQGNIVVTAKPGSGKTYTVVEKIAQITSEIPDYKGVIAISFTNKASDELKKRCKHRCLDTKQSFFGTIDSFYISQIIIPFASHITGKIIEYDIIKEENDFGLLNSSLNLDDFLISQLCEGKIYLNYTGETAMYMINNIPGTMRYIKARYSHIIIDEYQDCGEIQNSLFIKLIENGLTGIAVGDIDQAIYAFANRFPDYLISLTKRNDFKYFQLTKNHRCHTSISEYSLCLLGIRNDIPTDKRVFLVNVDGNIGSIASSIDSHIDRIKEKYNIENNNKIAILCKTNKTIASISNYLKTPFKLFNETPLDKDNSEWGRFFRELILSIFDENCFFIDYAEKLFSEEYEPNKYRKSLSLCRDIFSFNHTKINDVEEKMIQLAEMVYPGKSSKKTIDNLHNVLFDDDQLNNYKAAKKNELNIMTLHKSKGLEFNIVFHLDMYGWIIPAKNDINNKQDLNLHYVGITRAIDACYIMLGTERFNINGNPINATPSPFLNFSGLRERRRNVEW